MKKLSESQIPNIYKQPIERPKFRSKSLSKSIPKILTNLEINQSDNIDTSYEEINIINSDKAQQQRQTDVDNIYSKTLEEQTYYKHLKNLKEEIQTQIKPKTPIPFDFKKIHIFPYATKQYDDLTKSEFIQRERGLQKVLRMGASKKQVTKKILYEQQQSLLSINEQTQKCVEVERQIENEYDLVILEKQNFNAISKIISDNEFIVNGALASLEQKYSQIIMKLEKETEVLQLQLKIKQITEEILLKSVKQEQVLWRRKQEEQLKNCFKKLQTEFYFKNDSVLSYSLPYLTESRKQFYQIKQNLQENFNYLNIYLNIDLKTDFLTKNAAKNPKRVQIHNLLSDLYFQKVNLPQCFQKLMNFDSENPEKMINFILKSNQPIFETSIPEKDVLNTFEALENSALPAHLSFEYPEEFDAILIDQTTRLVQPHDSVFQLQLQEKEKMLLWVQQLEQKKVELENSLQKALQKLENAKVEQLLFTKFYHELEPLEQYQEQASRKRFLQKQEEYFQIGDHEFKLMENPLVIKNKNRLKKFKYLEEIELEQAQIIFESLSEATKQAVLISENNYLYDLDLNHQVQQIEAMVIDLTEKLKSLDKQKIKDLMHTVVREKQIQQIKRNNKDLLKTQQDKKIHEEELIINLLKKEKVARLKQVFKQQSRKVVQNSQLFTKKKLTQKQIQQLTDAQQKVVTHKESSDE